MTATGKADARFVRDPTSWRDELARYAVAAVIAIGTAALLVHAFGTRDTSVEATETDQAILIDLPAALASSEPASEAQVGPQQDASESAPATPPTPTQERPAVMEPAPPKPPDHPPPKLVEMPAEAPQPALAVPQTPAEDLAPAEPTMVPPKPEVTPPAAAPSAAANAQAPAGSDAPVAGEQPDGDEGRPHASARAITAWQRSLVGRLEATKRLLPNGAAHTAMGTVQVAFAIDRGGRLISERLAHSSGSAALDEAALSLVRRAAPYPTPPDGTGARDLSFIVPIRFRH